MAFPCSPWAAATVLPDRVAVADAGAQGQLDARASFADVIDQVALMVERNSITGATVLVLDPDPAMRTAVTAKLERFDVRSLDSVDAFWQELARARPALLVLAGDVGEVDVGSLCRAPRSDPRWTAVPIVVLGAGGPVAPLFAAGATDCLADLDQLTVRAGSHVERYRLHQALAETDSLTGLANRLTSTAALGQLIRLADRLVEPLCLAEIDIDHFKRVNDRFGHLAGDEALRRLSDVLRRELRREDVIARWGGEEFVVGMLGLSRNEGIDRMTDVLAAFRREVMVAGGETSSSRSVAGSPSSRPTATRSRPSSRPRTRPSTRRSPAVAIRSRPHAAPTALPSRRWTWP